MNQETKIQTLSLVTGTEACDARCPFCISKMTPNHQLGLRQTEINFDAFSEVCRRAFEGRVETVMLTGKGEPTLFSEQLGQYLMHLAKSEVEFQYKVPSVELQTNGIRIASRPDVYDPLLSNWSSMGLDLAAISVVSFDEAKNRAIYTPYLRRYISLSELVDRLHQHGIRARLACIMMNGIIDTPALVAQMVEFAKEIGADELTLRPVNRPETTQNSMVVDFIDGHLLNQKQKDDIADYLYRTGRVVNEMSFGATIFDVGGQNVCLTNSLTLDKDGKELRQLIFYPDGQIATSWTQ